MGDFLVFVASRGIGRAATEAAVSTGRYVCAMSCSGEALCVRSERIEAFKADALAPDGVCRALDGMEVVVQTLGMLASLDLIMRLFTLLSQAKRVLLPAMTAAGVKTLFSVAGFGAGVSNASISLLQRLPSCGAFQSPPHQLPP